MQIITLAAQKGGVGKTTLAVNLAVAAQAAGIRTALFDLDPQESATAWSERREAELPHVEPISARRLDQAIDAAEANGFALTIIDTPPAAGAEAAAAAQRADLVVIPCRPSLIDLDAIKRTAQLITSTGRAGVVVLNAAPPTASTLLDDARTLAEATGLRVARTVLRERSAYRAAWPYGLGVIEHEPKGKAAQEVAALQKHLLDDLINCTPANVKA
ncbi:MULTISPECIES: ParA family protein [Sphingomonadaceae]|uniref:Chromosome partitioning protein n=1 Tax=Stakelama pacifica TaxID=517720 RepID=A0A4R6FD39_9SPHN|nr:MULTISPECIES: ParA family protein [Sphingomonadaceae]MBN2970418.1 ParA family protein [Roseomonas aeriglobus]RSV34086.1 ParA family protein [Sphingomonas sp. ABOLE]TDN78175.1 chromosome partitioning protein [Stakelama pacifica]GGO99915.1 cobyrinic acid a,c-diamide synthase [Stakelama pacifica]